MKKEFNYILFFGILLSIFTLNVNAKTAYFFPEFGSPSVYYGSSGLGLNISTVGRYSRFSNSSTPITIYAPVTYEFALKNIPSGYDYLYFYGYSTTSIVGAWSAFGTCENIANSDGLVPGNSSDIDRYVGLKGFAFKCNLTDGVTDAFFNMIGTLSSSSANFYADFYLNNYYFMVSKDDNDDAIQSMLQQQIQQNQEAMEKQDEQIKQQEETNNKLDEMQNADISSSDKQLPDDNEYQSATSSEETLKSMTASVNMDNLSVGLDPNSSKWIWDTITSLIKSHTVVFGMFISILTIGIIKLMLGR